MDIGLNEEQELLKEAARGFLEKECPEEHVRAMEADERGYSPDLWRKIAGLGWHGLMIAPKFGGSGLSFYDLCIVVEEAGRSLLPGPFIPNQVVVGLLLDAGSRFQQERYLPAIARGSQIHTYAFTESTGRWSADDVALEPQHTSNGIVLNGSKLFVPDAPAADVIWVIARRGKGFLAAAVPRTAQGVRIAPLKTMSGEKLAELALENVQVASDELMEIPSLEGFSNRAMLLECAYLVGLVQKDFEITVEYAKQRVAFGRPIGAFQAIQHKAADMVTDLDGMRFITYRAAAAISERDRSANLKVAMAKAWCGEASRRVVAHGQQIHGAIGFTKEYPIQLYFRRQKHGELFWGDADFHRERVAQMLSI
ncbi:MAG: acyl-CoA/acyl-ACP dehydrogenase [Deltaproteobacteria bacterium]|nr:acyl-CoA/acyl-ACP dehydrogenase [Deltaproteobacteria bacterium]